jgi:hypothetical protein
MKFREVIVQTLKFGFNICVSFADELLPGEWKHPVKSFMARILFELLKYNLHDDMNYSTFWGNFEQYYDQREFSPKKLFKWYLETINYPSVHHYPLLVVNFDEVNLLFKVKKLSVKNPSNNSAYDYLNSGLKELFSVTFERNTICIVPFLTGTKSKTTSSSIKPSGAKLIQYKLSLLKLEDSYAILSDLYGKCNGKQNLGGTLHIRSLLNLMSGNPRFVEILLFHIGSVSFNDNPLPESTSLLEDPSAVVDGKTWRKETFRSNIDYLIQGGSNNPSLYSRILKQCIVTIKERYPGYNEKISSHSRLIAPLLVAYSLFKFEFNTYRHKFGRFTVGQLEEEGLVFINKNSSDNYVLTIPFIWVRIVYDYNANSLVDLPYLIPTIPILHALEFRLSPSENEQLALSILILRIQALLQRFPNPERILLLRDIFPRNLILFDGYEEVKIPKVKSYDSGKLANRIVPKNYGEFLEMKRKEQDKIGFMNGSQAPCFDSIIISDPPIVIQNKQSLIARSKAAEGLTVATTEEEEEELITEEVQKCHLSGAILVYITDEIVENKLEFINNRQIIIIDHRSLPDFYGNEFASCLSISTSDLNAERVYFK